MTPIPEPNTSAATVKYGTLYTTDQWNGTPVGSADWFSWLETATSFYYEPISGAAFIARRAKNQDGNVIWLAHRSLRDEARKTYLGAAKSLTRERLENAARRLNV